MATVEKRNGKNGTVYRITVADGMDSNGKQIRHRMNWTPPKENMSERQIKKALDRAVADFERQLDLGFQVDNRQSFAEYAQYVMETKERVGLKTKTLERYEGLLARVIQAIGHIKLVDLRPQHLNSFYGNLAEEGIRLETERATPKMNIRAWMKKNHVSRAEMARKTTIAPATIGKAMNGESINGDKAHTIAAFMGVAPTKAFTFEQNKKPLSKKTILEHHRLISTILALAEKEMLVPYNAAAKASPPKVEKHDPDYYQPEVVDAILDALDKQPLKWRAITYLLIDTGCRRGEAMGLKWECVDFESGLITIKRALLYSKKKGVYEETTKTRKTRTIKLAPETLELLKQCRREQLEMRLLHGDIWVETGYVFTQANGDHMNPDSVTDWLSKFSKENDLPHIHPHAFRHTAASMMIANGVDLVTAAAELGHNDATTTASIYAHQIAEAKAKASEARSFAFNNRREKEAEKKKKTSG